MATSSAINNNGAATLTVNASQLTFTTQPAGSVSGAALTTQPVVSAQDAVGNIDTDFTELVSISTTAVGSLASNTATAVAGVATFSGLSYSATADQQAFTLTANDVDANDTNLAVATSSSVTADVVASKLVFTTQPAPLTLSQGSSNTLTTVPVVAAQDANNITDTGYTTAITLAEVNGAGSAAMSATSDTDSSVATVTFTPNSGVATFTGMAVNYSVSAASDETFNLQATSGALTNALSEQFTATVNTAPSLSSLPSSYTVIEDVASAINLSAATFSDNEGDELTVTLAVNSGTIASTDGDGVIDNVTIANSGTAAMTLSGTIANIHAYLDTVSKIQVTTATNTLTNITLTITPNDGVLSGTQATSTLSVTAVNDAPTLTATASNPTFTENGAAASLFSNTAISTIESGQAITGLAMTVSNVANSNDEVLTLDGSAIALVNGGSGITLTNSFTYAVSVTGSTATVILSDGNATTAAMNVLVNAIIYQNNSENPTTTNSRVVTLTAIADNGGTENNGVQVAALSVASTVTVAAVNDIPVLAHLAGDSFTYIEDSGAVVIDQATVLTLTDVDSADFAGGKVTVSITSGEDASEDLLSLSVAGTVTLAGNTAGANVSVGGTIIGTLANTIAVGNDLVINLNANATPTNTQTLLKAITYTNTDVAAPTTASRNVRITVTDGDGGSSANNDITITVTGLNDAADIGGDSSGGTIEDSGTDATGTLTITDVDTNESTFIVQTAISTTYGTFCSGQVKLATDLYSSQYLFSDSFGVNPPL